MIRATQQITILLATVVLAFVFGGASAGIDANFSLSCPKLFQPDDATIVNVESYNFEGTIHFRAYKVEDPVAFFEQQRDVHSPDIRSLRTTNVFSILDAALNKLSRDARNAARNAMPENARNVLIGVADIPRAEKGASDAPEAIPMKVPKELENYPIVKEWNETVRRKEEAWSYTSINTGLNTPGVYLIEARTPKKIAYTTVIVSKYGIVTKHSENKLLVSVLDRMTGKPIDSYPLKIFYDRKEIASGKTDDGIFTTSLMKEKQPASEDGEEDFSWEVSAGLVVMGYGDGQFIIGDPYYYPYRNSHSKYIVMTYTERPIYRPGQEVFFKSIVREREQGDGLVNYDRKPLAITITDSRGETIFRDSSFTNDFGSYNNHLTLADEPPLGYYSIRVAVDGAEYYADFQVDEYKKPEYKVEVRFDKPNYARGEAIKATVRADYFFGSPVADAEVEYYVFKSRYWRPWWRGTDYEWYYESDDESFYTFRQEMVESNTGKLDANGECAFMIYPDAAADADYIYRVQANVVDQSRRSISGSKSVEVTRGLFSVSLSTGKYVYRPGEQVDLRVTTLDFQNRPVSAPFVVAVKRTWWDRVESWLNGQRSYQYKKNEASVIQFSGGTKSTGKETVFFETGKSGYYDITVTATDARGNKITETYWSYVADDQYASWYSDNASDAITIVPDKDSYSIGETAHALVTLPASNVDALVSIECGDIYDVRSVHFDAAAQLVEFKIDEKYMPNVYVSVSTMIDGEFYHESKRILALPEEKFLKVELLNDKQIYKPGESGTLQAKVTDGKGAPVRGAEVSLSIVDEAVYAVAPETTPDIRRVFYAVRYNEVETQSNDYFSFYGYSRSLRQEELSDDAIQKTGGLFASRTQRRERIAYGDVKGQLIVEPVVRKDFRDMIHWSPIAITDVNGIVKVHLKYPDNLTQWRATARVISKESQVGAAVSRVVARKNLLVRMETPRFFMENDECLIATVVHNYLNADKNVRIKLTGMNVAIDGTEQTHKIPRNGHVRIDWKVRCTQPGPTKLLVKALTNEESDAMELTIPTVARGIPVSEARLMDTEKRNDSRSAEIELPDGTRLATAKLYLTASPSVASAILTALDQLIGYPYGCVEQTMSRFLPTVIVSTALERLGAPMADAKKKEIPRMVAVGLKRLYGMQHEDGGWGWWTNDDTDPFMTAYVLAGMAHAKDAGHDVRADLAQRGITRLRSMLDTARSEQTTQAYMLYALAIANKSFPTIDPQMLSRTVRAFAPRDPNNYARALLALANDASMNTNEAKQFVAQLQQQKSYENGLTYWKGKSWHYNWQDDRVETTALALKALLKIRGDGRDVKDGIQWLLAQRSGDAWTSTRQTAITLFTLIDYMHVSKEMHPDYTVRAFVNDVQVWQKKMTRSDVFTADQRVTIDSKYLVAGKNRIRFEKTGNGVLYFAARLYYQSPENPIQPHAAGFTVKREYARLAKQRVGNEIVYVKQPFTGTVKSGDEIFVRLSVQASNSVEYFMLEDPYPAGCEVIKNTSDYKIKGDDAYRGNDSYRWRWWWADRDVRDQKVAFFARTLSTGTHSFTYIMRATIPGMFGIMPAMASLMYYPEIRGNASESRITILE